MNTPPRRGPTAEATANTAPNEPNNIGRSSRRVTSAMMDRIAVKIPAAPAPATARPKMSTSTKEKQLSIEELFGKMRRTFWRNSTDKRTDFEEENRSEVDQLGISDGEELTDR